LLVLYVAGEVYERVGGLPCIEEMLEEEGGQVLRVRLLGFCCCDGKLAV